MHFCLSLFIFLIIICYIRTQIETAPADFRFPTTNQTRHCFTRYIEYHRYDNSCTPFIYNTDSKPDSSFHINFYITLK
jgi:hypothetical protein